jgi:hypothetical protein
MTRMLTAICAVLVAMAAVAETASAKSSPGGGPPPSAVEEASASSQVSGDGSTTSATATCPGGTKVAGGGFDAPSSPDVIALVYESVRVSHHAWRSSVQLFDPGTPNTLTLTTYVYCRRHVPETRTSASTVPTDGQLGVGPTASAVCPSGEQALAGGFAMPPPFVHPTVAALIFDSARDGVSGWDARVVTGPAKPGSLTSEVYCSDKVVAPVEADGVSAPNESDSTRTTVAARCPAGLSPAIGGFSQPDSDPSSLFFVDSSKRVGDSWQVSGLHVGSDPAVTLDAFAYCAEL